MSVEFNIIFDDGVDFNVSLDDGGEEEDVLMGEQYRISGALGDLTDVNLDEPSDGQVLGFDEETGKWTNQNGGGGGGSGTDAALRASMAAAYSSSATYAVGDYCLKDGQLYECNTAITTAEAWTAAHWTAVTVGGELSDLKV